MEGKWPCNEGRLGPLSAVPQFMLFNNGTSRAVLLSVPMFCSEKLPPLGTKGDLILIDPRYYLIGDRTTINSAASDHVNFLKNQVTFRMTRRCDGRPWIEKAIALQDGATTVSPFVLLD